ncbi:MAG TPA: TetR/AcrR family transcriptional regulator [Kofleriaceae bacterium]|nr:TetR/AcrR family transcriptional regulator [Kofleriaceae bacterium]
MRKRTTYHHGDLRNALIAAALQLIAEKGVEGFTLRDAAKKAGVSVAAPYRHFTDRDDLLAAVAADCMQRLGDAMDRALEAAGDVDPLSAFRATGIAYVRFAVEHPAHFRVMYLPQVMARMPEDVGQGLAEWQKEMTEKLAAAQQAGELIDLPLDQLMLAAGCITHGLAHMIVDDVEGLGSLSPDQAAQLAITVTGVLGTGLLPRPGLDRRSIEPTAPKPKAKKKRGVGPLLFAAIAASSAHAHAAPTPALSIGRVDWLDDTIVNVLVFPKSPAAGAYYVIGVDGPLAKLESNTRIDRHHEQGGGDEPCPFETQAHLDGAPLRAVKDRPVALAVGPFADPIDPSATAPRLLLDLHAIKGVGVPTFGVDLDGDGAADLVTIESYQHGPYIRGLATTHARVRTWARTGKRWRLTGDCRWIDHDTIE